ncbi:OsmC family protein [Lactobacillus amylovorus]|uniref:OsmC family protein n=1 Tax=Lactobacillus amylovorus TaxID=1604 RepID=UPI00283F0EA5|nr:OsmC family protein [Lactobacillus amylovorus]GMM22543.1 OsmC family protein [Lactobacillus amylovorus]
MSEYLVKSKLEGTEWQIANQTREHEFICDDNDKEHDKGPNPVEYLCGSVNSCIVMSAGMVAKSHGLDVKNFRVENNAKTESLGHGKSVVTEMNIKVFFDSEMSKDEKEKFLAHTLHVSTVYQTVKEAVKIYVELA